MIRWLAWLLLVVAVLGPARASAQPAAQADAQRANELARDAKAKYDRGEWGSAVVLFESAEALAHSPVLLLYAARCHRNLGKLTRARELLKKVVAEGLPPDAPEPFANAQRDAAGDLAAVEPRIPKIAIDRQKAPASWVIEIDGAHAEAETYVDPGTHVVIAREGSAERFRKEVAVTESTSITVAVFGSAQPEAQPPVPQPRAPVEEESSAAAYAPGLVVLGVGAVGVGVGIALRVMALQQVSAVKDRCDENGCLASDQAEIEEAETLQTVSTVLFIAGGAAIAGGVVLLIVLPGGESAPSAAIDIGPAYLGVRGAF